jgi:PQQ-dependent dehydrogenase (s-GDH family)
MSRQLLLTAFLHLLMSAAIGQHIIGPLGERFTERIVASGLQGPWDITYGPDSALWLTESKAYRVSRVSPADGHKTVLLDLNAQREFPRYDTIKDEVDGGKPWPQAGLMGLALHPQLLTGKPYVYLAYIYRFYGAGRQGEGCEEKEGGCFFRLRIVRYTYHKPTEKLQDPVIVCDSIPASNDHNGGRLLTAPVGDRFYLFYSVGDMGAGQFNNAGRPNHAQNPQSYEGKVLRFNLEEDKQHGWIPVDNPFHNAVYTLGHRNPQGLTYAPGTGKIYAVEHGPFSDDEVNIIERGKNYGHPLIIGYNDGNYNGLSAGVTEHAYLPGPWHSTYPFIASEQENARQIGAGYKDPIFSFYPTSQQTLSTLLKKLRDSSDQKADWAAEAPSSVEAYHQKAIPGWENGLLITTLKGGRIILLRLNKNGDRITGDTASYFKKDARYRDLAFSPDGKSIFLITDSNAVTSGPTEENPKRINYRGVILEMRYEGQDR